MHRVGNIALLGFLLAACAGAGSGPTLESVGDQTASVGHELVVNLRAYDPDGDEIDYGFHAELEGAALSVRPDGTALFRWTPQADDVGQAFVDFTASDGHHHDTVTITIDVHAGEGSAPLFREPLGSGTTLDLSQAACVEMPIVVEDPDDTEVVLGQAEPAIAGAELTQDAGLAGRWSWCPSKEQQGEDRYPLVLTADDGENAPVLKNFLVVLRLPNDPSCPGAAPGIEHTQKDVATADEVEIVARVTDDVGLTSPPILYYSLVEPKLPIDFSALSLVEMTIDSGDGTDGSWSARVPNPVAELGEGESAQIFYVISARDDDDPEGECDHTTDLPQEGALAMTVTNPGDEPPPPACDDDAFEDNDTRAQATAKPALPPGEHDAISCGGDDDWYEVVLDTEGTLGALVDGSSASDLDLGLYAADGSELELADGSSSTEVVEECLPAGTYYLRVFAAGAVENPYTLLVESTAGSCGGGQCTDDGFEPDDALAAATYAEVYPDPYTVSDRQICSGDDDWFEIELYTGETVAIDLTFAQTAADGDLDLHFHDAGGTDLTPCSEDEPELCTAAQGQSADSDEHYEHTVPAGCAPCSFYVTVRGWAGAENAYDLQIALQ